MVPLPLADCARMLGIHPKTLHHWLTQAPVPFTAHARDARIKCVTVDQLKPGGEIAWPLAPASPALPKGACVLPSSQGQVSPSQAKEVEHFLTAGSLPPCSWQEVDLIQKLSCLETKVITMQEQLAQFALTLLQERERSVERRLSALETITVELVGRPVLPTLFPEPQATGTAPEQACAPHQPRQQESSRTTRSVSSASSDRIWCGGGAM